MLSGQILLPPFWGNRFPAPVHASAARASAAVDFPFVLLTRWAKESVEKGEARNDPELQKDTAAWSLEVAQNLITSLGCTVYALPLTMPCWSPVEDASNARSQRPLCFPAIFPRAKCAESLGCGRMLRTRSAGRYEVIKDGQREEGPHQWFRCLYSAWFCSSLE